jgi:hypothetical protein
MKQFIVHWHTVQNDYMIRGGYTYVEGLDKRDARRKLRSSGLFGIERGEKIRITKVEAV